ncbi:MAG: glycosyltransferase family 2 protein [Muribaculum sp.]|nr:glycosyltransferase family 2 protein [Muribaculum sp.]
MKLSIITTIYQAEKDLPRLLDSMMAQESPELEFFLIDNGCADGSAKICEEYAARDRRFKIHSLKENIGYIAARNLGLDIVDADYIGFCDSDDFLEPGGYDIIIKQIKTTESDVFLASWNTINNNISKTNNVPFASGVYHQQQIESEILPNVFGDFRKLPMLRGFMWKQIFKKSIIKETRFREDIKPYEDMLFNAEIFLRCKSITVSNAIIYNYVINEESITARIYKSIDIDDEYRKIYQYFKHMSLLTTHGDCKNALSCHILSMIVSMICISSRNNSVMHEYRQLRSVVSSHTICEMLIYAKPKSRTYLFLKRLLVWRCFLPVVLLAKYRKY